MPSHDVMPNMELYQPVQVEDALAIADRLAERGWLVGGGQDTYGWLKDRAKSADALIDLSAIESLRGIRETADGIEIGALTTLTEVATSNLVRGSFSLLADAAGKVASPQIRNIGTLGGNVSQDVRCWYYRRGLSCYRAGGNLCYADTPQGMNREHALFDQSRCVAAGASDTALALVALDASMVIQNMSGERVVSAQDFFVGPANNIENTTILRPGDILTAVRIPSTWANADFYWALPHEIGRRPRWQLREAKHRAQDGICTVGRNELDVEEPFLRYRSFLPFTGNVLRAQEFFAASVWERDEAWLDDERLKLGPGEATRPFEGVRPSPTPIPTRLRTD